MASYYNWWVGPYKWKENFKGLREITEDFIITFNDELGKEYAFLIKKGFTTDGGSIPKAFSWFADSWRENDNKFNATFILHDGLYGSGLLPKEQADDILRSSLRDCGESRVTASTICFAVQHFAGKHYGPKNDTNGCGNYIKRLR